MTEIWKPTTPSPLRTKQRRETRLESRIELLKKHSLPVLRKERKYWNYFFLNFSSFLYKDKNCYDSYVASVFKIIQTFFNYLQDEKLLPVGLFHKAFKIQETSLAPLILNAQQLQYLIRNKEFENTLPNNLKRTKDIFIFGCTVALRFSDLMRLKKQHVIDAPEGKYLLIHTKKTSTLVKLPLPDYLLSVIEKYKRKAGSFLLPRLSSTNLNIQVKQLTEKAGWTYPLPKTRYRQGKPVEIKNADGNCLRFCDQVTTHTMRRTAITTLLILDVPELVVRRISGHQANSKEFYKYVVVAQDYMNKHIISAYERLSANI